MRRTAWRPLRPGAGPGPALAGRVEQGGGELTVGVRHRGHALGDIGRGLLAIGGHQVEQLAHILHPAFGHVEFTGGVPGVVALHGDGQPFPHRRPGDLLTQRGSLRRVEGRQGRAIKPGPFGEPVRAQIRQLMVVSADPGAGTHERVQGRRTRHILLGDLIDRRHTADSNLALAHDASEYLRFVWTGKGDVLVNQARAEIVSRCGE